MLFSTDGSCEDSDATLGSGDVDTGDCIWFKACCGSSPRRSSTVLISFAPSLINLWVPVESSEKISPGTAKTSRPCSPARRAVMSAPLRFDASTTTVPSVNPLMIRLRRGKFLGFGLTPIGNSEINAPDASIFSTSARFVAG